MILVEFPTLSTAQYRAHDYQVIGTTEYLSGVMNDPQITQQLADLSSGSYSFSPQDISIEISDADKTFADLDAAGEDFRGKLVVIKSYDLSSKVTTWLYTGKISDYNLLDKVTFTVTINDPNPFAPSLPSKVFSNDDFATTRDVVANRPADDLGKPYTLCFGEAPKVPMYYANALPGVLHFQTLLGPATAWTLYEFWSGSFAIPSGAVLKYDIYCHRGNAVFTQGIDLFGSGWRGYDDGLTDQNSVANFGGDLSTRATDQWYSRSVSLTAEVGKTLTTVCVGAASGSGCLLDAWFKNIRIEDGSGNVLLTLWTEGPFTADQVYSQQNSSGYFIEEVGFYDFVSPYGTISRFNTVYSNKAVKAQSEYDAWDGSQTTQYPGFAFLRFYSVPRDSSGTLYQIDADVSGLILTMGDGLIGYWKMNEASWSGIAGEVIDSSGYGNAGTAKNGCTTGSGKQGNGGVFDGVDDYVDLGTDINQLLDWKHPFSFSAWVKTSYSGAVQAVFANRDTSGSQIGFDINIQTNGKLRLNLMQDYSAGNWVSAMGSTAINNGQWHHVAAIYDGTGKAAGISMFVDGNLETMTPVSDNLSGSIIPATSLKIGKRESDAPFNGSIDEVMLFGRTITATEVSTIYNSGAGISDLEPGRNFARVLQALMTNTTWGLSLSIDTASFDVTAATITDLKCDFGLVSQTKAVDLRDELLLHCRANLTEDESGDWSLVADSYQASDSFNFGQVDGYWENIAELLSNKKTALANAASKVSIQYGYNPWTSNYAYTLDRDVISGGQQTPVITATMIRDSETADRELYYIQQRLIKGDRKIQIRALKEGITVRENDAGTIVIPRMSRNERYRVTQVQFDSGKATIDFEGYHQDIYNYVGQTLPTAVNADYQPDYSNSLPDPPTGLTVVSSKPVTAPDGTTTAQATLQGTAPAVNFQKMQFGYGEASSGVFTVIDGTLISGSTWQAQISGLVPGSQYDLIAMSVNGNDSPYNVASSAPISAWTAPGDTMAPAVPTGLTPQPGTTLTWTWNWNANTESDFDHYEAQIGNSNFSTIYWQGVPDGNSKVYANNALSYGNLYCRVRAYDHSENYSAWSSAVPCTTHKATSGDVSINYAGSSSQGGAASNVISLNDSTLSIGANVNVYGSLRIYGTGADIVFDDGHIYDSPGAGVMIVADDGATLVVGGYSSVGITASGGIGLAGSVTITGNFAVVSGYSISMGSLSKPFQLHFESGGIWTTVPAYITAT